MLPLRFCLARNSAPLGATLRRTASLRPAHPPHPPSLTPRSLSSSPFSVSLVGIPRDFCVPHAPAALLKAALICAGIVPLPTAAFSVGNRTAAIADAEDPHASAAATAGDPDCKEGSSSLSLEKQLARVFACGGIRITSRSGLPQGSGMGTSSILAGELCKSARFGPNGRHVFGQIFP